MRITASNELKHIFRILESCENDSHLESVQRMFKNFKTKWENKIDPTEMIEFMYDFHNKYIKKKNKLCYLQ